MTTDLKELQLKESYKFDVDVTDNHEKFAGVLSISPSMITIEITGEQNKERNCSLLRQRTIDKLICHEGWNSFILIGLKMKDFSWRTIGPRLKGITYFRIIYEIDYLLFSSSDLSINESCISLEIHSETISKWIGFTAKQDQIVSEYQSNKDYESLTEFIVGIEGIGNLIVSYNVNMFFSLVEFKAGFNYPPSMFIGLIPNQTYKNTKKIFDHLYNFVSLITGDELELDKIKITFSDDQDGSLYFPLQNIPKRKKNSLIFFPLGEEHRFNQSHLPAFPIETFGNYFQLEKRKYEYWNKYIKYRRMGNIEERFLGYFRLLEALCYKKKAYLDETKLKNLSVRAKPYLIKIFRDKKSVTSFLSRLPHYNNSKYNTEKNIQDFFVTIPEKARSDWVITKQDIGKICKLRNDIIHANDYAVSTRDLAQKTKFIEVLLIFYLLQSVGIEFPMSTQLISRIDGYNLITPEVEIKW